MSSAGLAMWMDDGLICLKERQELEIDSQMAQKE